MSTFYDLLEIAPTATTNDIQAAFDNRYNYWRQLINHYDRVRAEEASSKMRLLEEARTTLLDPVKRADYDAQIGQAIVGGLADSTARAAPGNVFATPPAPRSPMSPQSSVPPMTVQRVDAWVCPKCLTPNSIGTRFCKNCSQSIGIECPGCRKLTEAAAKFCSECGIDIKEAKDRIKAEKIQHLQDQINYHQAFIERVNHWINAFRFPTTNELDKLVIKECEQYNSGKGCANASFIVAIVMAFAFFCGFVSSLNSRPSELIGWTFTGIFIIGGLFLIGILAYLINMGSKKKAIAVINNHQTEIEKLKQEIFTIKVND